MSTDLADLGRLAADTDAASASDDVRQVIDQAIRASLLCAFLGIKTERWVWGQALPDEMTQGPRASTAASMLAGLYDSLCGAVYVGTLAGAADLDPMDAGPSHTVLPATLASCIASRLLGDAAHDATDSRIISGVLAGVDVSLRIRRTIGTVRPGVGFHSPGVFGTVAAAVAAARVLGLRSPEIANAMAIALTRAGGLSINSASSRIGLTHFGWGTAHGLEAALLAASKWSASHDVRRALDTLFGDAAAQAFERTSPGVSAPFEPRDIIFKHYACNIYLNLVVLSLAGLDGEQVDRIRLEMPWIPQLDCPVPVDIRQARNSAQAVAAIAVASDRSYDAFSNPRGLWAPSADVARLLPRVEVEMDEAAPTGLANAKVRIRAWRGHTLAIDEVRTPSELGGWGEEHATVLLGGAGDSEAVSGLYGASYATAYGFVDTSHVTMAEGAAEDRV
jgi:hypothetical protein